MTNSFMKKLDKLCTFINTGRVIVDQSKVIIPPAPKPTQQRSLIKLHHGDDMALTAAMRRAKEIHEVVIKYATSKITAEASEELLRIFNSNCFVAGVQLAENIADNTWAVAYTGTTMRRASKVELLRYSRGFRHLINVYEVSENLN